MLALHFKKNKFQQKPNFSTFSTDWNWFLFNLGLSWFAHQGSVYLFAFRSQCPNFSVFAIVIELLCEVKTERIGLLCVLEHGPSRGTQGSLAGIVCETEVPPSRQSHRVKIYIDIYYFCVAIKPFFDKSSLTEIVQDLNRAALCITTLYKRPHFPTKLQKERKVSVFSVTTELCFISLSLSLSVS